MHHRDPIYKQIARNCYTAFCGARMFGSMILPKQATLAVNYGGVRVGDMGGPLVKVSRLQEFFPEARLGFNLVYLLSNAPYLPDFALDLLKLRRIPIVYNQNGVFYEAWFAGDWRKENQRMARAYHAADWVFFQSEFCRLAAERYLGARDGRGEILYNAVDTERFRPASEIQAYDGGEFRYLVTGKIGRHLSYRLETSIAGLKIARASGLDAKLIVAGTVESHAQENSILIARKLGVLEHIEFMGPYTQAQAPAVYRRAHAYIMTKHSDPCPNTVLEALATGLPVVYFSSGGVPELVGVEAGVPIQSGELWDHVCIPDVEALGRGMVELVENYANFAKAARNRAVSLFDIKHWIARHKQVFETLIRNS